MSYVFADPSEVSEAVREFSMSGKLPDSHDPRAWEGWRQSAKSVALALNKKAADAGRDLTPQELKEYNDTVALVKALGTGIEARNLALTRAGCGPRIGLNLPPESGASSLGWPGGTGRSVVGDSALQSEIAAATASWMRNEISASDNPLHITTSPISSGLAIAIRTDVNGPIRTYYANDAFARAGATIYETENVEPLVKPIVSAGTDPGTYVEGTSATESDPMQVDAFTFGGTKNSRLVKVSEISLMNSAMDLAGEILAELGASIVNGFTATATTALMAALHGNSNCFVDSGLDHYDAMLSLTLAPQQRFQNASNKFMLSRADLKRIKNVRSTQNEPLFDAESQTILGYGYVLNDNLTRVVFGSWADGAFVRKSPLVLQRLNELYSEQGHVGFKITQFLDQKFLASVTAVETQPLFYTNLETAGS